MKNLYLFDIDRTLILSKRDKSYSAPIKNLHDFDAKVESDYSGMTDKTILAKILRSEGWSDDQIQSSMGDLIKELERTYLSTFDKDSISLIPGVSELLQALRSQGHTLGLITGNIKAITKAKLVVVDIYSYFTVGAYGDDPHNSRAELVKLAVDRAGYTEQTNKVYVIGDTVLDVKATLEAGVKNAVGVSNGFCPTKNLLENGASIALEDFIDTDHVLDLIT
jgi:phosphoglycolate phosphatase-like HAD superfamily hydrolase